MSMRVNVIFDEITGSTRQVVRDVLLDEGVLAIPDMPSTGTIILKPRKAAALAV
jgi:hypothetical protein